MDNEFVGRPPQIEKLYQDDPYLKNHETDLLIRWNQMTKLESSIISAEGGLSEFAGSYRRYGIIQMENGDVEVLPCHHKIRIVIVHVAASKACKIYKNHIFFVKGQKVNHHFCLRALRLKT